MTRISIRQVTTRPLPLPGRSRTAAGAAAGAVAILVNTLALAAADLVPLETARGGLLRFLANGLVPAFRATGADAAQALLRSPTFKQGFHVAVGLLMAQFYAHVIEPAFPGPVWRRSLFYALAVWLVNAIVILPANGEGFAGRFGLTLAGMGWFAAAHVLFFLTLGALYERWSPPR